MGTKEKQHFSPSPNPGILLETFSLLSVGKNIKRCIYLLDINWPLYGTFPSLTGINKGLLCHISQKAGSKIRYLHTFDFVAATIVG